MDLDTIDLDAIDVAATQLTLKYKLIVRINYKSVV